MQYYVVHYVLIVLRGIALVFVFDYALFDILMSYIAYYVLCVVCKFFFLYTICIVCTSFFCTQIFFILYCTKVL